MTHPTLQFLPTAQLIESPLNVRQHHDPVKHRELVESIRTQGVITPLVVRRHASTNGLHEVAAGHRRLRAAKDAGVTEVPVSIREMDDREFAEVMIVENLQRQDPAPLDEAEGYQRLIDELGYDVPTLAARFGKGETYVRERLKLTNLVEAARDALRAGHIELGHAILLARAPEARQQELLAGRLLKDKYNVPVTYKNGGDIGGDEDTILDEAGVNVVPSDPVRTAMTVAELRTEMAEQLLPLAPVKWALDDARLVVTAGACSACPKRSGAAPSLFPELDTGDDRCTDASCYRQKTEAWLMERIATVRSQAPNAVLVSLKSYKPLKKFQRERVLALDVDARESTARGAVPAIVVESNGYSDETRWEEIGTLRDVKLVEKDPASPQPTAKGAKSTIAGGRQSDASRKAHEAAGKRFIIGAKAVIAALIDDWEQLLPDRCADFSLRSLDDEIYVDHELATIIRSCLEPAGKKPVARRSQKKTVPQMLAQPDFSNQRLLQISRLVAALALTDEGDMIPSWYGHGTEPQILEATGTYAMPAVFAQLGEECAVPAATIWEAALQQKAPAAPAKPKKGGKR